MYNVQKKSLLTQHEFFRGWTKKKSESVKHVTIFLRSSHIQSSVKALANTAQLHEDKVVEFESSEDENLNIDDSSISGHTERILSWELLLQVSAWCDCP